MSRVPAEDEAAQPTPVQLHCDVAAAAERRAEQQQSEAESAQEEPSRGSMGAGARIDRTQCAGVAAETTL